MVDADTGNELLGFRRRGVPYIFLRDSKTKRFIHILRKIELRYFGVVDYSEELASKGNPIYADFSIRQSINPEQFQHLRKYEDKAETYLAEGVQKLFGVVVVNLIDMTGLEYGSKSTFNDTRYKFDAVWKHHMDSKPRSKELYLI